MDNTLSNHAAGFVVRAQGNSADGAMAQFHHSLKLSRLEPSTEDLAQALARAEREYFSGNHRLSICPAQPCNTLDFDVSESKPLRLSGESDAIIVRTGCHGPCKPAPILALRLRDEILKFADVLPGSTSQWNRARKIVAILLYGFKEKLAVDGW